MALLYDVSVAAINQHIKNIFDDHELEPDSVIKKYLITAPDGKIQRSYEEPEEQKNIYVFRKIA